MGGEYKWPTVEETKVFRKKTRELVEKVIKRSNLNLPVKWDSDWVNLYFFENI